MILIILKDNPRNHIIISVYRPQLTHVQHRKIFFAIQFYFHKILPVNTNMIGIVVHECRCNPKFSFSISFFTACNGCVHLQTHSCVQFTRAYSHTIQLSLQLFSMVPQVPSRTSYFASVCLIKQILPDIHK